MRKMKRTNRRLDAEHQNLYDTILYAKFSREFKN